jgi:hypothetical protein
MASVKLSPNFSSDEFGKNLNDYQLALLKILAENLQIVRDRLNSMDIKKVKTKNISITISSGVRDKDDYDRLKANGYNPSSTSDHFCGWAITAPKPTLGAVDINITNCKLSTMEVFKLIVAMNKAGETNFGQVIYEVSAKGNPWIHVSNNADAIFTPRVAKTISRNPYLISLDNGKTFKAYND